MWGAGEAEVGGEAAVFRGGTGEGVSTEKGKVGDSNECKGEA